MNENDSYVTPSARAEFPRSAPRAARMPMTTQSPVPVPPTMPPIVSTPAPAPSPMPTPSQRPGFDNTTATGEGRLVFRVTTGKGAIPLPGARVTLWDRQPGLDPDRGNTRAVLITDRDGRTELISLPAPAKGLSLTPSPNGAPAPFACYDAEVLLDGYYTMSYICIPVFDGVTSIQPADLIPLPENGNEDGLNPEDTTIVEGENPNL